MDLPVTSVLLLGPTGAGKTPLGDAIAAQGLLGRKAHHFDFGSELRSVALGIGASSYSRDEQDFIIGVLERGLLLENEHFQLAKKIIEQFLVRSRFRAGDVLMLNGIPRHEGQAKDIALIARVHALVVLECTAASVFCRIRENAGGDRTGREDDERLLIEKKLGIFNERTAPLIEHYERLGARVYRIVVTERSTVGSIYRRLSGLAAAHPPIAFVAEPPQ